MTTSVPEHDHRERHTPGAGLARAREILGDRVPELTDEDRRHADELLEAAREEARVIYGADPKAA